MYYFFEIFEELESCFERHEFCTLAPLVLDWFVELKALKVEIYSNCMIDL